jgi:hypothetical protein
MELWHVPYYRRFLDFVRQLDLSGASSIDEAILASYTAELQRLAQHNGQALQAAYRRHREN